MHYSLSLVKGVLSLKGYSVGNDDLLHMSKKLSDLGIFTATDLDAVATIQSTYDAITRGQTSPSKSSLKELGKTIDDLAVKLRDAVIKSA